MHPLGEMISNLSGSACPVPGGFATTAFAFNEFLELSGLNGKIHDLLDSLDVDDIAALNRAGQQIRDWVVASFQPALEQAVREAYDKLSAGLEASFAVRSSATAEDMPDASFAGQQETFLTVTWYRCRHDRHQACVCLAVQRSRHLPAGSIRGYDHKGSLSRRVQRMVRSDLAASGVMFTLDTESGFNDGLHHRRPGFWARDGGAGAVNPDEFYVHKPTLKAGRPAVVRKTLGSKLIKMTYSRGMPVMARQVKVVDTTDAEQPLRITDEEVMALAKQVLSSSSSTTAARWTSSGPRMVRMASSTSFRPVRKPCVAARKANTLERLPSSKPARC